uniref:Putative sugar transporter n=1 Tax=Phaedon cochleariae TaxID=80249 RepID=W4VS73_PHACE
MTTTNIFEGTFPQLVAVLTGTLAAISDGMQYGWTAPVIPNLLGPDSPVKTSKNQAEWLELLLMIGSFSGLTLTMYLVDKIGRKRSILLSSFVTLIVWIVIAVAPRIEYIFVARLFAGAAGNMAFVATPMYIAEIADQKIRGFLSSIIYLMMLVGILIIYAVAPYIPFYAHCVIGGGLVLIELIVFPFMPESPYYLLYRDQPEAARSSLKRLRPASANVEKELEDIQQAVERQRTERARIQDLVVVASNRRAILIMTILNGAQHFSSISVFLMNLHVILEAAGSIYIDSSIAAIIFSFIMLVAATMASLSIDKYGRKTLLISSSISTGLCLLVIAIYFTLKSSGYDVDGISWIPIVSVMTYACAFKLGLGMVPIVLTAELFPTKMKAIGMTLADGIYVIAAVASLQIYQQLGDRYGLQYPFYVFSGSCFVAALFTYFLIPETKGKTLEQIQYILKGIDGPPKAENTSA